jgi:hypothetical protein
LHVNELCSIRATVKTIEIYINNEREAAFPRNYNTFKRYTTLPEHMPESHKAVSGWSSERFLSWAEKTGPNTRKFIENLLESREYPVQTYRACMGIMRFRKSYSAEIMEHASQEALNNNTCSYKYFSIILKQSANDNASKSSGEKIITNNNLRGSSSFAGGGIHA